VDLKATQRLLARLYTDDTLRQRFAVDPASVAKELNIALDAARQMKGLSGAQVATFARSLARKRLNEVQRALPATCGALGSRLAQLFGRYAAQFHPQGMHRGLTDALVFAKSLSREPRTIADLARYEANWLQFRYGRAWPLLAIFRSDPRESSGGRRHEHDDRWLVAVWFRFAGRPRHVIVRLPKLFLGKARDHVTATDPRDCLS
jgi:hypothetical protein